MATLSSIKRIRCRKPLIERFWAKVDKRGPDDCWLWTGGRFKNGYGSIYGRDKTLYAHRVSWEIANGSISDGLDICHKCDVRHCINPSHLFKGTRLDNILDMIQKGRFGTRRRSLGSTNYSSRLTETDIPLVFQLHRTGLSYAKIAQRFYVSKRCIGRVIQRETWAHITE